MPQTRFTESWQARPCSCCGRRRLGQRLRQLQRRAGAHGSGSLSETAREPRTGCAQYPAQCVGRIGPPPGLGTPRSHARLLGETGCPPGLQSPSVLSVLLHIPEPLSQGWAEARQTNNVHMEAFCAKGLMYLEQVVLDGGRQTVGWLLTGYPEPHWNTYAAYAQARRSSSTRPFSKLAKPSWATACLAYLRDLDWVESRLKSTRETPSKPLTENRDEEEVPQAKAKSKWKARRPKAGEERAPWEAA